MADMIIRSVKANPATADKWILDEASGGRFFFHSGMQKLLSQANGKWLEYRGEGVFVECGESGQWGQWAESEERDFGSLGKRVDGASNGESDFTQKPPTCRAWVFPKASLQVETLKRSHNSELNLHSVDERVTGFKGFVEKWALEESIVRHLLKFDRQLLQYVIPRFNPTKAKAKNALQAYIDSLVKFPQKWRLKVVEEDLGYGSPLTADPLCGGLTISTPNGNHCSLNLVPIQSEWFALGSGASVDGLRLVSEEGPLGPLVNGSVITVNAQHGIPDYLILIEIGSRN